jgi:hypothetical protein
VSRHFPAIVKDGQGHGRYSPSDERRLSGHRPYRQPNVVARDPLPEKRECPRKPSGLARRLGARFGETIAGLFDPPDLPAADRVSAYPENSEWSRSSRLRKSRCAGLTQSQETVMPRRPTLQLWAGAEVLTGPATGRREFSARRPGPGTPPPRVRDPYRRLSDCFGCHHESV